MAAVILPDRSSGPPSTFAADPPQSPVPRRVPVPRWLDLRLVGGVVLVLGSTIAGARVIAAAHHSSARLVVRHHLAAGAVLRADDLGIAQVRLAAANSGAYLSRRGDAVGKRLVRDVSAGELLPRSALAAVPVSTTVTVPLGSSSAPRLHRGDRIELWVSTTHCAGVVLLPAVTVQGVRTDGSGSFGGGTDEQDVVIGVAPDEAQRVVTALAMDGVAIRAGVVAGAPQPLPPATLPSLAACTGPR
jgi:hypothetical protein